MSEILEVSANSIGQAIAETRQLLEEHGHTISPTTFRFTTASTLADFVTDADAGPLRPRVPQGLSDPSLTGMSRPQLAKMIERLSHHQAARTERHRYRRRGAERLPGARGGVFRQKITDAERVLATGLYQRGLCTRETLAELFEVSRRTIGSALLEVGPLLQQDGYIAIPAGSRYSTAAALLDSVTPPDGTPETTQPPC